MSEENQAAFSIDGDWLSTATPNEGGEFKRLPIGDYRFKVVGCEPKAKRGDKPHVMLKASFVVVEAYDNANKVAIGMPTDGLYAGSKESPKFMKDRLACLIRACKVQVQIGKQLNPAKDLIGREFDGTIFHELSDPSFDEATGMNTKRFVNARLCGERPVGTSRTAAVDPIRMSHAATTWLEKQYGGEPAGETPQAFGAVTSPPWEQAKVQSGYKLDSDIPGEMLANIHEYRAFYQLGTPMAEQARAALVQVGFDPDGSITPDHLTAETREAYLAKFASPKAELPKLGVVAVAPATSPAKGTRSKRA